MSAVRRVSRVEVASAFRDIASTEQGQIMLRWLMSKFGFTTKTTLVSGHPDKTAFQEGQRSVMIAMAEQIEADLDALATLDRQQDAGTEQEKTDETPYLV